MGRWGCGVLSQVRALHDGVQVARALMVGIVVMEIERAKVFKVKLNFQFDFLNMSDAINL